jgi:hypothetical protein
MIKKTKAVTVCDCSSMGVKGREEDEVRRLRVHERGAWRRGQIKRRRGAA